LWDKELIHDAGEIWHLLIKSSYAFIDQNKFGFQNVNLNPYTTLILVNGNYSGFSKKTTKK
jgi:hypothetical protein